MQTQAQYDDTIAREVCCSWAETKQHSLTDMLSLIAHVM